MNEYRYLMVVAVLCFTAVFAVSCKDDEPSTTPEAGKHAVLGDHEEAFVDSTGKVKSAAPATIAGRVDDFAAAADGASVKAVTIDFPLDGAVFPPEFIPPTFYWHDDAENADTWVVTIDFEDDADGQIRVLIPGSPPPEGELDLEAIGETNEVYVGTEYQQSARGWIPSVDLWKEMKRRSVERPATVTFTGYAAAAPGKALSAGKMSFKTSKDPVGAPFFYRDVPLMAAVGKHGRIIPLGVQAIPLIAWRLRDVSLDEPKLVLKGMPSCGNCHSFSLDGKTLGMDVDGPDGDKGMYAVKEISETTVIDYDDVITWNSFPDKPKDHRTIGFMSRMSPDGKFVASTVNEALFVKNFQDYKFLQVFYPTRGIIGVYSRELEKFMPLGGADDTEYVHCSPVWTPDMKWVIFSRAKAMDPYTPGMTMPDRPNDPSEPKVQYDLYRVPFNNGKGGKPEPIKGASQNGYSNTFPKVSPDGKWIVWTRCKNGLLMRPDGMLCMVPVEGGEPRVMNCNTPLMNSWHSFSPNGRWMVFSSKSRTPYTQAFLTHIDEDGNDSPAILVPNCTASNRAVNLPEFLNAPYAGFSTIEAPVVDHHAYRLESERMFRKEDYEGARKLLAMALEKEPTFVRALVSMGFALMRLGQYEQALLYLEEANRIDTRDLYALYNRGYCYLETGRAHMAWKTMLRLMELAPKFPEVGETLTRAKAQVVELDRAIKAAEQGVASDPESLGLHRNLAELYRRAGRLEEAVKTMEVVIVLSGEAPPTIAHLAWVLSTNPDDAIRDGKRAVELAKKAVQLTGGKRPEPLDILAAAYAEIGEFEKAVETSKKAVEVAKVTKDVTPDQIHVIEERGKTIAQKKPVRTAQDR